MQTTLFLSQDTHVDNRTHLLIEVVKAFAGTAPPHEEQESFLCLTTFIFLNLLYQLTHTYTKSHFSLQNSHDLWQNSLFFA